ncbi:MAG: gamma-glutamyl-gamma-aminobutyrate hydrolase family protein [Planctomycetes bacterium]|nr:gamma-glutamyl-gamma-aminobutyrate hydrolase family protein [Planctomycetota bacterium]MCL4730105.1 gamma-glutamyl-gamma-aminobutyrate hydrolase family protein [Planctomycetota bacterium]
MTRPVIGICMDHVRDVPNPAFDRSYLKLYPQYVDRVVEAGGTPLVIPIVPDVASVKPLLGLVRGVVLIGSDDYPAQWFGKQPLPTDDPCTPQRAAFDREFIRVLYDETDLPVLAVCGGMQLTVIHTGGTLIQHLPDHTKLEHRRGPDFYRYHDVDIEPGTLLHRAVGVTRMNVITVHHQAAEVVKPPLKVTARATDGVIEAVEFTNHRFRVGVQWHPERMPESEPMRKLWRAFVAACA